jgi:hypothetical protein
LVKNKVRSCRALCSLQDFAAFEKSRTYFAACGSAKLECYAIHQ